MTQINKRITPSERPRFLSEADCQDIANRLARLARGSGITTATIFSTWTANVRWARNLINMSGEVRNDYVKVDRNVDGAQNFWVLINDASDAALVAADRRAERIARLQSASPQSDLIVRWLNEPAPTPTLFFESTYQLDAEHRVAAAQQLVRTAADAGMFSAGYMEVGAHSIAMIDTVGHVRYCKYTTAQFSVTVRDPKGAGSGWAGVDWPDWSRIDGPKLTSVALNKCLKSHNAVAIEPGRYTTILEPQAVCDFVGGMIGSDLLVHQINSEDVPTQGPFGTTPPTWKAKRGEQVVDSRITITSDPLDPELGFPPFNVLRGSDVSVGAILNYETYHPVTWIEHGVLQNLGYDRQWGLNYLHLNTGMPIQGAFRMSGGETSVDEMIASTKRGLLVTRFDRITFLENTSLLQRGYTRDGLWLIENGKISKAVKNFMFVESILFALNNVEQLGVPQRAFRPKSNISLERLPSPVIVPPIKVRDFSFTALIDAV